MNASSRNFSIAIAMERWLVGQGSYQPCRHRFPCNSSLYLRLICTVAMSFDLEVTALAHENRDSNRTAKSSLMILCALEPRPSLYAVEDRPIRIKNLNRPPLA